MECSLPGFLALSLSGLFNHPSFNLFESSYHFFFFGSNRLTSRSLAAAVRGGVNNGAQRPRGRAVQEGGGLRAWSHTEQEVLRDDAVAKPALELPEKFQKQIDELRTLRAQQLPNEDDWQNDDNHGIRFTLKKIDKRKKKTEGQEDDKLLHKPVPTIGEQRLERELLRVQQEKLWSLQGNSTASEFEFTKVESSLATFEPYREKPAERPENDKPSHKAHRPPSFPRHLWKLTSLFGSQPSTTMMTPPKCAPSLRCNIVTRRKET